ncbi:MAG: PilT/PilU family type 4a pilus ATPase [Acidobacteria bacterium]|nr:PilT/PilU family type 4a pilus ATPase [Acidobacteriota bacterium]
MDLTELLRSVVHAGASDLHLKAGNYPMMRVHGALRPASYPSRLVPADLAALAATLIPPALEPRFLTDHEVDFAHSVPGLGRFRCNVFRQRGTVAMAVRVIPADVGSIASLGLPPVLTTLAEQERGLILLTGTTGSGKSTTLASLVDHINRSRAAHIVTAEDPIEYLHQDRLALISQREVDVDTRSFADALRSALRQDPDVIMVGEMRDLDTIEIGLTAAETGHLVMSTVHTLDATETINRLVTVFPTHQHGQVRLQLAARSDYSWRASSGPSSRNACFHAQTAPAGVSRSRSWSTRRLSATVSLTRNAPTSSLRPLPPAARNTACRRLTSQFSSSTRAGWCPMTRR